VRHLLVRHAISTPGDLNPTSGVLLSSGSRATKQTKQTLNAEMGRSIKHFGAKSLKSLIRKPNQVV
jgi:hypothetical protein